MLKMSRSGSVVVLAALAPMLATLAPAQAAEKAHSAAVTVTSHFVWTPTSDSLLGDSTVISNGATNAEPHDLLFITPNVTPGGISPCPCISDTQRPFGVWYDSGQSKWAIFNEDGTTMNIIRSFNVLVVPRASQAVFVVKATSANTSGNRTLINSPLTNGKPSAVLQITQDFNPGNSGGTFNDHQVGVRYEPAQKKWAIFNEDGAAMVRGAAFDVLVGQVPSNGGATSVLKVTSSNRTGHLVHLSNKNTTGNPNNVIFVTQNVNPGGKGSASDPDPTDVGYVGSREVVLNWDSPTMNLGTAFNLLIYSS